VAEPMAHIDTRDQPSMRDQSNGYDAADDDAAVVSLMNLNEWASAGGDISHLLEPGQVTRLGVDAVRQWRLDEGSRADWKEDAERYLNLAAQMADDDREPAWEGAADINYPILSTAVNQFVARAGPEL